MVAYSFKKQFGPPIMAGTKAQTIRADRKRHARPGEELQLYTGMRTRQCRLIARVPCIAVYPCRLDFGLRMVFANDGWIRTDKDLDAFAVLDGFRSWDEMRVFWRAEHPDVSVFRGVLIRWTPLAPADALDIGAAA
ncbi:hypothetical protein [Methylobacterium sp. E-045]|uniref:hypothetical protein n=1 Tax=Methylobacterium sp. E-045 TaxID=2836575 RepID=UPI001FBB4C55|nr:hypothetical protein [Methylobacterium sp. E-045]MCJ2128201.1 hypothetical protein [Methylobacterium sp. E-045]